jgi:hypothetical protein
LLSGKKIYMEEKIEINQGHYVEALHVAYMVQDMMENYLIEHPVIDQNKELKELVGKAQGIIGEVYQKIGAKID